MLRTRRKLRTATYALAGTVVAAAALAAGPAAQAADSLPSYWCYINGVEARSGMTVVRGTSGADTILCENDVENVIIDGMGGDDNIRVKGMVVDSQVLGGEGDDTIQVNNLYPRGGNSSVRGGAGDDTIITALVVGTAAHGATVYGDHGADKITTGSVLGEPGEYQRGGGQVFGNDGSDTIRTGNVDLGGRVLGGSEHDIIEPKSVGAESAGIVQGGPGNDTVRGQADTFLVIGPGYGQVDGGLGTNSCKMKHFSTGERVRSSIANCTVAPEPTTPTAPSASLPANPAAPVNPAAPANQAKPATPTAPSGSAAVPGGSAPSAPSASSSFPKEPAAPGRPARPSDSGV
ncbi:hypothetical protein HYE82_31945 [Streptomyces sp. BR123]|uniref:hypothetical protein n=1 Tax=Streptomyces sp. BR123 TaxID=2749828 RepID=UPI0015C40E19|nr:hypothetical protein [Streptomyces sp. BR123]NXY98913.1 hypothetical protein [Streptomyces sp. BR123]